MPLVQSIYHQDGFGEWGIKQPTIGIVPGDKSSA
jgi:hypothetical protein